MLHADFDQAPFTVAWEVTRACAYACVHCRADAQHQRDPHELTTEEARALIDRLAAFGNSPILIFTGGDPMMRRDLSALIAYATQQGLRCSLTPTATALPTSERLTKVREAGIRRIALSLDAPRPEVHDEFRKVPGSWQRTMDILHRAQEVPGLVDQREDEADRRLSPEHAPGLPGDAVLQHLLQRPEVLDRVRVQGIGLIGEPARGIEQPQPLHALVALDPLGELAEDAQGRRGSDCRQGGGEQYGGQTEYSGQEATRVWHSLESRRQRSAHRWRPSRGFRICPRFHWAVIGWSSLLGASLDQIGVVLE